jgi:hypothetical protein
VRTIGDSQGATRAESSDFCSIGGLDHMLRSSQGGTEVKEDMGTREEDSEPPPSYIWRTMMCTATMKTSMRTKRPAMERRIRFGQDGRVAVAVIVHLGGAAGRGREGDWRVAVEIEAEDPEKFPRGNATMRT